MVAAVDLVLSSGFLAFSRHVGFLRGIEQLDVDVGAVVGTSSGALIGALWWSGFRLDDVSRLLTRARPLSQVGWHPAFWRGPLTLRPVIDQLRAILPSTFEGLNKPFGVGVTDPGGQYRLLTSGPLPEAVAASCAMPYLFRPVNVAGQMYIDGGAADHLGIRAWRQWRGTQRDAVVHEILGWRGTSASATPSPARCTVVESPRAAASFFSLGDFEGQAEQTRQATVAALSSVYSSESNPSAVAG